MMKSMIAGVALTMAIAATAMAADKVFDKEESREQALKLMIGKSAVPNGVSGFSVGYVAVNEEFAVGVGVGVVIKEGIDAKVQAVTNGVDRMYSGNVVFSW